MTRRDPLAARTAQPVALASDEGAPIALKYDYDQLPAEHRDAVREAATDIKRRERRAAMDIVEIGRALKSVQARLDHGEFLPWLDTEFGWQKSMAYNFMAVADKFPKFGNLEQFGLSALYLLSGPNVPDEAIAEANEAAQRGERVTHKAAKQIVAKHKPAPAPAPAPAAPSVVGKCRVCGRPLTDPASVGDACGPTCAAKLAAAGAVDEDDAPRGVPVVGNGPLEDDDDAPALPDDLVALGCKLALDAGFYHVRYGSHRSEYASYDGAVAWCRRITGTDGSAQQSTRQERIAGLLALYQQVLSSLPDYGQLTGDFTGALPLRRVLEPMISRLEANVTKGAAIL